MNNIRLLKPYDPGTGRMRQPGQLMDVDNATKAALIADGIAEHYTDEVEVKTKTKKQTKTAKAEKGGAKAPAKTAPQKLD